MVHTKYKGIIFFLIAMILIVHAHALAESLAANDDLNDDLLPETLVIQKTFKPGFGKPVGNVVLVSGQVVIIHQSSSLKGYSAAANTPLFKDDTIVTLEDSSIEIHFKDNSKVSIEEKTKFTINKCEYDDDLKDRSVFLTMIKGKIRFLVTKLLKFRRAEFKVKTRTCVAGVRGSDFVIMAGADLTRITAFDDTRLAITNLAIPEKPPLFLNSFEQVTHRFGEAVPEPEKIETGITEELKNELPFSDQPGETSDQDADFQGDLVLISDDQLVSQDNYPESDWKKSGNRQKETLETILDQERVISDSMHEDFLAADVWETPPFPPPPDDE